ncbi:MAG: molybdopterin molybdotransferase MoeA [Bacillota bacterium]|nr:molybdopterin molybdotransferase MoeA [Bacillota bacterium]
MLLSVPEALARLLAVPCRLGVETAPLEKAAGRILAEPLHAPRPLPHFDRAAMDGYALRSAETAGAGPGRAVRLRVAVTSRAGEPAPRGLAPGEAARIFTGAALPPGADAVIRQEEVARDPEGFLLVEEPVEVGRNVDPAGCEAAAGQLLLPAGSLLGAPEVALAASLGLTRLPVRERPRLAVLSTGAELVEPGQPLAPGMIYSSNRFALAAIAAEWGAQVAWTGSVDDDAGAIAEAVRAQAGRFHLLVTSGGASVGDYDCVAAALDRLGAEILFHGVALKPGTPALAARLGDALVLGLPGTPGAAYTVFRVLAVPLLQHWLGVAGGGPRPGEGEDAASAATPGDGWTAVLESPPPSASPRLEQYLAASLRRQQGRLYARPLRRGHANSLLAWLGADALARIPAGPLPPAGSAVEVLPLHPWRLASAPEGTPPGLDRKEG